MTGVQTCALPIYPGAAGHTLQGTLVDVLITESFNYTLRGELVTGPVASAATHADARETAR